MAYLATLYESDHHYPAGQMAEADPSLFAIVSADIDDLERGA